MLFHKKRNIDGLLLLDKPQGLSSNHVLQKVKSIFHAKKAGYIGTLDPLATGILPICFGESTKFSQYLTESNKRYSVVAKLGEKTSTSDSYGEVIKKRPISFTAVELDVAIKALTGFINQVPSMYSAIKHNGIPLYKYARNGIEIIRKTRQVYIYKIDSIKHEKNLLSFNVFCSKGTYIRTLVEDLGEKLGCGAHITFLRRCQIRSYTCSKLVKISDLYSCINKKNTTSSIYFQSLDNFLMPIDSPISFLPQVYLSIKKLYKFKMGQKIFFSSSIKNGLVRVVDNDNKKFIGLGKVDVENSLIPYRLISTYSN